jgi:mannose-6-phosphate isomerase-like protein (cupin superfamily)
MAGVVNAATIRPRPWGEGCSSYDLVDGAGLIVVQETMPPGTSEVRHFHVRSRQVFYVLAGTLTIERAGEIFTLHARDGLEIEPGTVHVVSNLSRENTEFLAIASPTTKGGRTIAPTE